MGYSKSINIFLPTGSSDGPIELEMLNWNGMVIKIPRKEVDTYTGAELNKPGIYFLFCKSEETGDSVYVGEAENLLLRLKQHINDHKNGKEKFFWQAAVCVSGKDLNKALIKVTLVFLIRDQIFDWNLLKMYFWNEIAVIVH